MEPLFTATDVRQAVASGRTSAVEVCRAALERIAAADGALNAFRTVTADRALARAAELDARSDRAGLPLLGVPIALKDNMCTRGVVTTASSRILAGYVPPYDATVVDPSRIGRRRHRRENELRRVRHGLLDGELRVRADPEPVGARSNARRIQRRIGGGGRGPAGAAGVRLRYRRIDPSARRALRRHRFQAVVRARVALRPHCVRLLARSDRPLRDIGGRRGARDGRDRRSRSARFDGLPRAAAAVRPHAPRGRGRSARRPNRRAVGPPERGRRSRRDDARSRRRSTWCAIAARRSARSRCLTASTPSRSTTSSPPPKRARTWRGTTASATGSGTPTRGRSPRCTNGRGAPGSAAKSSGGSSSAPTCSARATTMLTT